MRKWLRGAALLGVLALAACDLVDPVIGFQDGVATAEAKAGSDVTAAGAAAAIKQATELLIKAKSSVGSAPSPEAVQLLTRASEMISQAAAALKAGDPGRATSLALESASVSRKVLGVQTSTGTTTPADKAAGAIKEAVDLLVKAKVVMGPTPSTEVLQLLTRASEVIGKAEAALKAGDAAGAASLASESAAISRKLLTTPLPTDPSAKAAGAIKEATELLAKALVVAGPTPSTEIARALASAEELLRKAKAALESRDFTTATGAATESAAISRKVMNAAAPEPDAKK